MKDKVRLVSASDFIRPPFQVCPFCRVPDSFGVLHVSGHVCTRRCRRCWKLQYFDLPAIEPKILYLDQFFLSNLIRAVDPTTDPARLKRMQPHVEFYQAAYKSIQRLVRLHLVVCPESPVQYDESVVSADFEALKRLWESLSCGVFLEHPKRIRNAQITTLARQLNVPAPDRQGLPAASVLRGRYGEWHDWMQIVLNVGVAPGLIEELRETREASHNEFLKVWELWKNEKSRGFDYWLRTEQRAIRDVLEKHLQHWLQWCAEIRSGRKKANFDYMLFAMSDTSRLLVRLDEIFLKAGVRDEDVNSTIWAFLESGEVANLPFIKIASHIFAALAQRAANGQNQPKRSPFKDVDALAAYLPYCDGLFADNEMALLLNDKRLRGKLDYKAQIFSLRNKAGFMAFLQQIEQEAAPDHLALVRNIFGNV